MIYAFVLICLSLVALLAYQEHLQVILRASHAAQVESLLQRIQAPEAATYVHQLAAAPVINPPSLPFDDDDAFHKTRDEMVEDLAREMNLT